MNYSLNVIPELQPIDIDPDWDNDPLSIIRNNYYKLRNVRKSLKENYRDEFLVGLIAQATDNNDRYKPKLHKPLELGG